MKLTRREVLQAGVRGGSLLASALFAGGSVIGEGKTSAASGRVPPPGAGDEGYIDAHVHVWTPDLRQYPLAQGYRKEQMQPSSFTPKELLAHARPCGVSRIVLIQMSYYGYDNTYMVDTMRKYPGVFGGVAVIDENRQPEREMRRLARSGVRGFRIYPGSKPVDRWLDGPGMAAMWKYGAKENLSMCHLVNPDALPSIDRMCRKFPDTPVVIDHFARIGIDGIIRDPEVEQLCRLASHRNTSVKISAFYALGKKQAPYLDLAPMIRRVLDAFGPERLMWATDCPFQVQKGHTYRDSIDLVLEGLDFLSEGDRQWLVRRTAERVFFA